MFRCDQESVISIYSVNSSANIWRIASSKSTLGSSRAAQIKGLEYSLVRRIQQEDRFETKDKTLVKGLYKFC